jgi:hypothetical protein
MAFFYVEFEPDEIAAMSLEQWVAVDTYGPVFIFGGVDLSDPFVGD